MARNVATIGSSVRVYVVGIGIGACSVATKTAALGSSSRHAKQKNATHY